MVKDSEKLQSILLKKKQKITELKEYQKQLQEQAKDLNYQTIYLTVNKYNINSIMAYQKIGFIKTEELFIDIGNGYVMDDFRMEKLI